MVQGGAVDPMVETVHLLSERKGSHGRVTRQEFFHTNMIIKPNILINISHKDRRFVRGALVLKNSKYRHFTIF